MATDTVDAAARKAIREETGRNMFVVAGAGSGKTSSLVGRIATLVLRDGVQLATIAAVTFTDKAGAELRDRLRATFEKVVRDGDETGRAARALTELDLAAIGTLHSFAARVLLLHAIEAGLPPQLTTADELSSDIAEEEEWGRVLVRLLDDEGVRPALRRTLMSTKMDGIQGLYKAPTRDWDLIDSHVLPHRLPELRTPDVAPLLAAAGKLDALRVGVAPADGLALHVGEAIEWVAGLDTDDDLLRYEALQEARNLWEVVNAKGELKRVGAMGSWKRLPGGIDEAKNAYADFRTLAMAAAAEAASIVLRHLTHWLANQVLTEAERRQRKGELTFQDLLVVSRQVLRDDANVAESLSRRYTHLLLDEFQDTDPIQIELAVRIAGGRAGAAHADWRDITVPPGSLFVVGDPKQSIYRFRRADIALYLDVQEWFRDRFGPESIVELETNFRTVPGVVGWVNSSFGRLIQRIEARQPAYLPLDAHRPPLPSPPSVPVTYLGWDDHPTGLNAGMLRAREAADVAGVIAKAVSERWIISVCDPKPGEASQREIRKADIAILVPARTSLPVLKRALDAAGIDYRASASTLLYLSEDVAELLLAVQAVADRSDEFALVMTLRSALFGLGDDDLWRWKQAGGRFSLSGHQLADAPEQLRALPVFGALAYLQQRSWEVPRLSPADLLERIVRERRVFEVAADTANTSEAADRWRRIRFVIDQARAWSETAHGGVRSYLEWAHRQTSETAQVYESVLPETDIDAVQVMTVHSAKGLEFPMVVMSGLTSLPGGGRRAIKLLWGRDNDYAVSIASGIETTNFSIEEPIDEQMSLEERKRLWYVSATRARDYLAVSLHRIPRPEPSTPADYLRQVAPDDPAIATRFESDPDASASTTARQPTTPPAESRLDLWARLEAAQKLSARPPSRSASGLEGSDPEVVLEVSGGEDEPRPDSELPLAKDQRDLDTPSYNKGRDATAIGIAVHAVLQSIDLATGAGLDALVDMQCTAGGIPQHAERAKQLVRRAMDSDEVRTAAAHEHWRESLLAMTNDGGEIIEGYADLIYRADGVIHVIDYKTDTIRTATELAERERFYGPQLRAYADILREATGAEVHARPLFLDAEF